MLDLINRTVPKHIVTIEDPLEFLHRDRVLLNVLTSRGTSPVAFSDPSGRTRTSRRIVR